MTTATLTSEQTTDTPANARLRELFAGASVLDLIDELNRALDQALFASELRADLEQALDAALASEPAASTLAA